MLRPSRRSTLEAGATAGLLKAPKPPKLAPAELEAARTGAGALLRPEKRSKLAEAGAGTEAGAELKSANKSCEAGAWAGCREAGAALNRSKSSGGR